MSLDCLALVFRHNPELLGNNYIFCFDTYTGYGVGFPKNSMSLMRAIAEEDESASACTSSTMLGKAGSMTRVSSEDKLSRQMMKERSVIVAPQSLSGSVTAEQDGRLQ